MVVWKGWMPCSLPFLFPRLHTYLTIDWSHNRLFVLYVNMANHYLSSPNYEHRRGQWLEYPNRGMPPVNTEHFYTRYLPWVFPSPSLTSRTHALIPFLTLFLLYTSTLSRDHPTAFPVHLCSQLLDNRSTISAYQQRTRHCDSGAHCEGRFFYRTFSGSFALSNCSSFPLSSPRPVYQVLHRGYIASEHRASENENIAPPELHWATFTLTAHTAHSPISSRFLHYTLRLPQDLCTNIMKYY
jgi:hypothetical protein